jgi:hypothetical protein
MKKLVMKSHFLFMIKLKGIVWIVLYLVHWVCWFTFKFLSSCVISFQSKGNCIVSSSVPDPYVFGPPVNFPVMLSGLK